MTTVTATGAGGSPINGVYLRVLVLTDAAEAGGATAAGNSSVLPAQAVITPNITASLPVFALLNFSTSTTFTALAGNTFADNAPDNSNGTAYAHGYYSGAVTGGIPVTCGSSAPTGTVNNWAVCEIPGTEGTTPAQDPSAPALAVTPSSASVTTAAFTPPPGAVLAALVATNGGSAGGYTLTLSDSTGLTWTRRAYIQAGAGNGVAGVFTATVPAAPPVVPPPGPGMFTSPAAPQPPPFTSGPPPPALAPVHRLSPGTPYVAATGVTASAAAVVTVSVTTATSAGDAMCVVTGSNTSASGAPVPVSVTDTRGNTYTLVTVYAAGVSTTTGQPGALWVATSTVALSTSDSITVTFTGATATPKNVCAIGIPAAVAVDQSAIAHAGSSSSLSATTSATAWPGEMALAVYVNGNGGGAPTGLGGFTQVIQQHSGSSTWTTVAYQPVATARVVTGSFTTGAGANLTVITATFPGVAAADPAQASPQNAVPPGMFISPAGYPPHSPGASGAQPPPLPPAPPASGTWDATVLIPPGPFTSPSALPRQPVPGQPAVTAPPPPPPPPPGSGVFPAVPGLAWPGQATPGSPGPPSALPAGPYLIGRESDPAGSATTTIMVISASGNGDAIVIAVWCPSATPTSVTDTGGNTYALAASDPSGQQPTWVYVAAGAKPLILGTTITISWSSAAGAKNTLALGIPGVKTTLAVDQAVHADGTSAAPSVTTGTLAQPAEVAIAVVSSGFAGGGITWGSGWAGAGATQNGGTSYTAAATRTTSATTPVTATGTLAASTGWTTLVVTLELAPVPVVVQQVTSSSSPEPGLSGVEMTTTAGNAILVLAGWGLGTGLPGPMPAAYVSDSAGNYWVHLGTSAANTGARCAAWICTNAMAAKWVSCSLTAQATSLAWVAVEISGLPALPAIDVNATATAASATVAVSGTQPSPGTGFAIAAAGASFAPLTAGPAGWSPLSATGAGSGVGAVQIYPYWLPSAPTGPVGASWTVGGSILVPPTVAALMVTIDSAPVAPAQPNANLPVQKVEMAFGFSPGDVSAAPPAWTDITAVCVAKDGDVWAEWTYGREYELATPEAGELVIGVNNNTGTFTPGNTASPYYPNVILGTPVRLSAYWSGRWYHVAFGYVERWPQEWPDLPQWGLSKMTATDAVAVLTSDDMPSALQGALLADGPYALIACSEQYLTFSSGVNAAGVKGSFTPSDAQGLPAANLSRTNQRAGIYVDGDAGAQADTGQSLNLLGDSGTGVGTSSATPTMTRGPGVVYSDPQMPGPATAPGCSVEMWFMKNDTTDVTLLTAYAPPSPYNLFEFALATTNSATLFVIVLTTGPFQSVPFTMSPNTQQAVVTFATAAGGTTLSLYLNGALAGSWPMPSHAITTWRAATLGCARYAWGLQPAVSNYTAADLTLYTYPLTATQAAAHYAAGALGASGDTLPARTAKILTWGSACIPRGGPLTYGGSQGDVFQGPAYSLSGAGAADALNTAALSDGGVIVAMPSGVLTVLPRWWLYAIATSQAFGDALAGEIPFLPGQAWDYDNTYLYNISTAQQVTGATTGITVTTASFASQRAYFPRSALSQQNNTTSTDDTYDMAAWGLARYQQPSLRVREMSVDAAKNPAAWVTVLTTRPQDVCTVTRRPVGGAVITSAVQVQKITGKAGPGEWEVGYQLSPYVPENAVLILDKPGYTALGSNTLPR